MAETKIMTAEEAGKIADKNDLGNVMLLIRDALEKREDFIEDCKLREATRQWLGKNGYSIQQYDAHKATFKISW